MDIDLHFRDGTANIFAGITEVSYFHPSGWNREEYLKDLRDIWKLKRIATSLQFQLGLIDISKTGILNTEDYFTIGKMIKEFAERATMEGDTQF